MACVHSDQCSGKHSQGLWLQQMLVLANTIKVQGSTPLLTASKSGLSWQRDNARALRTTSMPACHIQVLLLEHQLAAAHPNPQNQTTGSRLLPPTWLYSPRATSSSFPEYLASRSWNTVDTAARAAAP